MTSRYWKFIQHHRTIRQPLKELEKNNNISGCSNQEKLDQGWLFCLTIPSNTSLTLLLIVKATNTKFMPLALKHQKKADNKKYVCKISKKSFVQAMTYWAAPLIDWFLNSLYICGLFRCYMLDESIVILGLSGLRLYFVAFDGQFW